MRTITIAALSAILLAGTAHAAPMSSYPTKATPVGADTVLVNDSEAADATKKATLSSIVALSPSMTYPGPGVPLSTGSAWGTSYAVGTAANNLVQLNGSAQLPDVSGALITGSWTGTLLSGQTTHTGAIQTIATELDSAVDLTFSTGLTDISGTITVTYPVTAEAFSGSGWNGDTGGLTRNDVYDYVHLFDTDDDGLPNKVDLSSTGLVKTDADGVISVATAGTDYQEANTNKVTTSSKATTYTIGTDDATEAYGGTIYVTSATTITAPAVAAGMNFSVVTIGAIAVSLDVNASDRMILDGTALSDGDKATNTSTAGDTITCQYESADGWFCWSGTMHSTTKHWTDGN